MIKRPLCLASQSIYRKQLLERLDLVFTQQKPLVDEDLLKIQNSHLSAKDLCLFLGHAKGAETHGRRSDPNQITLSGDQLVCLDQEILGKTPTPQLAFDQLRKLSGKTHFLMTSFFVFINQDVHTLWNCTELTMRSLTNEDIQRYLELDQPYDCAGTYKIEAHGISLFTQVKTDDFTAIQGIPLLALNNLLKHLTHLD